VICQCKTPQAPSQPESHNRQRCLPDRWKTESLSHLGTASVRQHESCRQRHDDDASVRHMGTTCCHGQTPRWWRLACAGSLPASTQNSSGAHHLQGSSSGRRWSLHRRWGSTVPTCGVLAHNQPWPSLRLGSLCALPCPALPCPALPWCKAHGLPVCWEQRAQGSILVGACSHPFLMRPVLAPSLCMHGT
jgi:hypothetical protein